MASNSTLVEVVIDVALVCNMTYGVLVVAVQVRKLNCSDRGCGYCFYTIFLSEFTIHLLHQLKGNGALAILLLPNFVVFGGKNTHILLIPYDSSLSLTM